MYISEGMPSCRFGFTAKWSDTHTHTPDDVNLDQWGVVSCGDVTGAYRLITAALQYHKVAARLSLCASLCYVFDGGRSGGREAREGTRSFRDKKKKKKQRSLFLG